MWIIRCSVLRTRCSGTKSFQFSVSSTSGNPQKAPTPPLWTNTVRTPLYPARLTFMSSNRSEKSREGALGEVRESRESRWDISNRLRTTRKSPLPSFSQSIRRRIGSSAAVEYGPNGGFFFSLFSVIHYQSDHVYDCMTAFLPRQATIDSCPPRLTWAEEDSIGSASFNPGSGP